MKNTTKKIVSSVIALALSFLMLIGTTWAWFTDSVTSAGNKIQAGNLKLDLELLDQETGVWNSIKDSKEPLFTHENWEPGYTDVTILKVENEGSLALKWEARFVSANGVSKLAEAIDVYVKPSETELSYPAGRDEITAANGWEMVGSLDKFIDTLSDTTYGDLLPGKCAYLGIALKMRENAGNEYQNLTLGAFDILIVATQKAYESDDLGDDYDNNAEWPEFEMNFETTKSLDGVATLYNELAEDVIIRHEATGAYAVVPAGVKLKDGATELKFSGKSLATGGTISDSARNYDIHIEGIADDNTKCITVYIGAILPANLADTALKLYHEDTLMTRVNSVSDFAMNNQFTYDPATGAVVLYVDNFSVFSAVQSNADEWDGTSDTTWYNENDTEFTLTTAEQFAGFRDLVDGGNTFAGKTVKLGADIDLADKPFDPIGFGYYDDDNSDGKTNYSVFMGTFDGAGRTIYNLYENCWELDPDKTNYSTYTYSTAGAGLFASIKDATIKNLAVSGAEIVFECVDMGVVVGYAQGTCHFENIVVTDSNIANYNRYTGGVVGEVSYGPYGIDTSLGYSHTFKNVTVDSSVKVSGLWGSFGCGMGGVIGGKWGDATVKMENVISAAEMDVYNDVVSAYQWYAFRGCGMLIGHTEEPYSDGRHSGNATASFLTCENVKVYYGDWVNYHYYEFEDQDNATGRSYPWVRAEEGEYCDPFSNIRYGVPTHEGVKVSDLTEEELTAVATDYTPIVFDQLYGADRGMYGTATHEGVTVNKTNVKTVYIHNNESWTNLKLDYWYKNGEDTWTNLLESIVLTPVEGETDIYKLQIPHYADSFKITGDNNKEITFRLIDVANNGFYTLEGTHTHDFSVNDKCICGCIKATLNIKNYAEANSWENGEQYAEIVINSDIEVTASSNGNNAKYYTSGNNWRIYQSDSGTFKISSTSGNIISVKVTYSFGNTGILTLGNEQINSEAVVEVNDVSATFGVGNTGSATNGQVRITAIEVIYSTALACEHKQITTETKSPTCTESGYTAKKCVECGKIIEKDAGDPATGHSYSGEVTKQPTCTEQGLTTFTCAKCQSSYQEKISATGHTDVTTDNDHRCDVCGTENVTEHDYTDGVCNCGAEEPSLEPEHTCESICSTCKKCTDKECNDAACADKCVCSTDTPATPTWEKVDLADIQSTDVVIIVWTKVTESWAMSNDNGTGSAPAAVKVTVDGNNLTGTITDNIKWNISNDNGYLTIYPNGTTETWLYCTNTNNGVRVGTNANNKVFTIDASSGYLKNTATERYLGVYTTNPDVRCYTNTTGNTAGQTLSFYKCSGSEGGEETTPCEHTNIITTTVDATCTEAGSTTVTCDDCGETISSEVIEATGHQYENGICSVCDAKESASLSNATLSFTDSTSRTEFSTLKQVWVQNGITFTNNKSSSTNNVADYSNPVRLYANSEVIVKGAGMTEIVFDCNSSSYATALQNSIGTVDGANVTISSDKVTVTFDSARDSFTIAKVTAQVRIDSITVNPQ